MTNSESYSVESACVHSGKYANFLTLKVTRGNNPSPDLPPVILFDKWEGEDGCVMTMDGIGCTREELIERLPGSKSMTVEITRDPQRYGMVVKADFKTSS